MRSIAILISCLLATFLFAYAMGLTDRFIYYPMQYPQGDWELRTRVGAEELWFQAQDGTRLNAWWFPSQDSRFATLFLHGNAGNLTHRAVHGLAVRAAGSAFLVVDYRGYGKSGGKPSERGLYADADAAYAELLRLGYRSERIIVHGESLGSAVAADLAARKPCAGLILESPFTSARDMANTVVPVAGGLLVRGFDTYGKIARVHVPMLVIHGEADEIVPLTQGEAVFQKANSPKTFWKVPGAGHNDLLARAGAEYVTKLRAFYSSLATGDL